MTTDREFMARWFTESTRTQLAIYNERMANASAYRGSPRWERERRKAYREYEMTTTKPAKLYRLAMEELESLGEISEATDELLTQFDKERVI